MAEIHFKLHPHWQRHTGHCQITYTTKNQEGQWLVYCLQDNGRKHGGIRLMRCTQDGEPSHEVSFTRAEVHFERPPVDPNDREDSLERLVNNWIDLHESKTVKEEMTGN